MDFGIDPSLKQSDKDAIIRYRGDIRRIADERHANVSEDGQNGEFCYRIRSIKTKRKTNVFGRASLGFCLHPSCANNGCSNHFIPPVISDEVEAMVKYFEDRTRQPPLLILPDSVYMQRWDIVTLLALMFTAFVTPYEVALLESEVDYFKINTWDPLFVVNRLIDLIFLKDMVMQFFLAFRLKSKGGTSGLLVRNFRAIRRNYLSSWFTIDLLSILPFDMLSSLSNDDSLESLKIIRVIRLLRLLKLARIFKASRIFKRLESRLSVSYSVIGLVKFAVLLLVVGHWMACMWCMVGGGHEGQDSDTWIASILGITGLESLGPWDIYVASFYWSIVTITSVGYGDITPVSIMEMQYCTLFLLMGSCLWAYIIGSACGIVSNLDVDTIEHQQTMDQLNSFMSIQGFEQTLKIKVRAFFNQTKDLAKSDNHKVLISRLSPCLKEEVTAKNCQWVQTIYYMKDFKPSISVAILDYLVPAVFTPQEKLNVQDCLCVVSRGVASRVGVVKTAGTFWGEDFILSNWDLKEHKDVRALTYIEVLILSREGFFTCMEDFPEEKLMVRKAAVKMAIFRGILKYARAMKDQGLRGAERMKEANLENVPSKDEDRRFSMNLLQGGHDAWEEHEFKNMEAKIGGVEHKFDAMENRLSRLEQLMTNKFDSLLVALKK